MAADETTAKFAVELRDGVTPGARSAEEALGTLKREILGGTAELRQIQSAMSRLKSGGLAGSQAFKDLRDRADALKKSIGSAQAEFIRLGGSLDQLKPERPAGGLEEILASLTKLPGPLGQVGSRLGGLAGSGSLAALGLAGVVAGALAVAAAITALVASVGAATGALFRYGLAAASARREELLHLEGLVSIRTWYSRAAGSATELQASIDRVSASSAISRARVAGYAEQLYRAGLRGEGLRRALGAVTTTAAVQGEEMANRVRGLAVGLARTGGDVAALADRIESRLGGTARRMSLSWDRQMERLRESWGELFRDIRLDGALEALRGVLRMFEQSTVTGRALRVILTSLFQPVLDGVGRAGPSLQLLFEGATLATLELGILFLRTRNALMRTFGGDASGLGSFLDMTTVGQGIVYGLAGAILLAAGAVAALALNVALLAAPFVLTLGAIGLLAYGVYRLGSALAEFASGAWERFTGIDWSGIGREMIAGLVRGLSLDGPAMDAVRALASSLTSTLRSALDIRSPSRVFAQLGRQIPRGLAVGVEAESGTSSRAIEGVASVPQGGALGGASSGRAGGNVYVSIDRVEVVAGSAEDVPASLAERIREALEEAIGGVLVETGGAAGV